MDFNGYKKRNSNWNYGGPKWRLSRSKIDLFTECPRCFYLDNKLGIRRPSIPSFNLNTAVDVLLKKEFDIYRAQKKPHPLMEKYNIDAIPYQHKDLDKWRENFVGFSYLHEPTGLTISGAIDDVWVNPKGELYIVDYKSTSKDQEITLDDRWKEGYKRQMEIYQWLFRQSGFDVSETGYFVYANGRQDRDRFDAKLDFDITILPYEGKTEWVEPTVIKIQEVLDGDKIPESGENCEHCPYCEMRDNTE
jgi:CRISPR/Cas system-associated exonuclease Cas4 (RecB family)